MTIKLTFTNVEKKAAVLLGISLLSCCFILFSPMEGIAKKPVPPNPEIPTGAAAYSFSYVCAGAPPEY